jgi:hypothetical protein
MNRFDFYYLLTVLLLLFAIAFGVNWMAYEQRRANQGIFVPFPAPSAAATDLSCGPSPARTNAARPLPTGRGIQVKNG